MCSVAVQRPSLAASRATPLSFDYLRPSIMGSPGVDLANSPCCVEPCLARALGFLWSSTRRRPRFSWAIHRLARAGRTLLGTVAVATKHEIELGIVGGLFVLEAVSVIVQVVSFKLTGKRVFKMAPIHHHFEQKGWTEPQIVIRFWIIAIVLALAGLSTLKLRGDAVIPVASFAGKKVAVFGLGRVRGSRARVRCWLAALTSSSGTTARTGSRTPPRRACRPRICALSIGRSSRHWCCRLVCRSLILRRYWAAGLAGERQRSKS